MVKKLVLCHEEWEEATPDAWEGFPESAAPGWAVPEWGWELAQALVCAWAEA
jgi:hypothetical protein